MLPCNGFGMVWAIVVEEEGGRCHHLGDDEGYENRPYQRRHEQIHDHSLILRIGECKGTRTRNGNGGIGWRCISSINQSPSASIPIQAHQT